jgi:site-specific DNA-cytosine methylase
MANRWTQEEDDLLLKLRGEGYTSREMTLALKERSYAAIRTRLALIAPDNLNRKWTEKEKALVLEMKSQNKSNKVIAKAIDRTPRAVASFISRYWDNIASQPSAETDSSMSNNNTCNSTKSMI